MGGEYTLGKLAEDSWQRFDDHDALWYEGTWHRQSELAERSRRVAGGFIELGVCPGDRVVVMMANCPEVVITYLALWRAGAIITPAVFLMSPPELRHVLTDSGAVAIVTSPELLVTVNAATEDLDVHVIVAGEDVADTIPFGRLEAATELPLIPRENSDAAAILYTGGTTGQAKGVRLTHSGLFHTAQGAHQRLFVEGLNRALVPVPLSHAYGLIATVAGLHATEPSSSVLLRWFSAPDFVKLAAEHHIQLCPLVPAMIQMLLSEPSLAEADLSSLRLITCGAAPLPRADLEEFERRVPSATILEGYGLTETSAVTTLNPPGERKVGSVGTPIPGMEVIVRDDEGKEVEVGADGEICVRSEYLMTGYFGAAGESATAAALVDGELHTGDIGHLDADGFLYVVDRKKDLIIRGGFNVFPRDVEDALAGHPDVASAGVVGRPDPEHGEEVVAFVALRPEATVTADELRDWSKERLGAIKYPREVRIIPNVPVTSVLKTDRKQLRKMLTDPEQPADAG